MDQPGTTAFTPSRCPECGHSVVDSLANLQAPTRLKLVPLCVALVGLIGLGIWLVAASRTSLAGGGVTSAVILQPPVTHADLRRIADPASHDREAADLRDRVAGCLFPDVVGRLPGDPSFEFSFNAPQAMLSERTQFGWPAMWYLHWQFTRYDDAVTKAGFLPFVTKQNSPTVVYNASLPAFGPVDPRKRWTWDRYVIAYRPSVEETGGIAVWHDFYVWSALAVLATVLAVWWLTTILIWIPSRVFSLNWFKRHARGLRFMLWIAGVAVIVWLNTRPSDIPNRINSRGRTQQMGTAPNSVYWRDNDLKPAGFTKSTLILNDDKAQVGRTIARNILALTPDADPTKPYLGIAVVPESHYENGIGTSYNEQFGLFSTGQNHYRRKPEFGSPERVSGPAGLDVQFMRSRIFVYHRTGDPEQPTRYWSLGLDYLGVVVCALFVVWLTVRTIMFGWWRLKMRRRHGRNQCVACGHALGPPPLRA